MGKRNAPTAAYAFYSPEFHYDTKLGGYIGGQFWDGSAKNLVEQAKGPFLNPLEMNNKDEAEVVAKIKSSEYAVLFEQVFGPGSLDDVNQAFNQIAEAVAEFESTPTLNRFSSKYDAYLAGKTALTVAEERGLNIFKNPMAGNCIQCHPADRGIDGSPPLFTTFGYENTGIPKNPNNPVYTMSSIFNPDGKGYIDNGLGGFLDDPEQNGKMKIPTLRNIAVTAPYMHQGSFDSLDHVMVFYCKHGLGALEGDAGMDGGCPCGDMIAQNEIDGGGMIKDGGSPMPLSHNTSDGGSTIPDAGGFWNGPCILNEPEVDENRAIAKLKMVRITPADYEDLIAFLKTLTDGYSQ